MVPSLLYLMCCRYNLQRQNSWKMRSEISTLKYNKTPYIVLCSDECSVSTITQFAAKFYRIDSIDLSFVDVFKLWYLWPWRDCHLSRSVSPPASFTKPWQQVSFRSYSYGIVQYGFHRWQDKFNFVMRFVTLDI